MEAKFYFGEVEDGPLMQGDIFPSVPFPFLKLSQCSVIEHGSVREANFVMRGVAPERSTCFLAYKLSWGIIVSQSCDLQMHPGKTPLPVTFAAITLYSSVVSLAKVAAQNRPSRIAEILLDRTKFPTTFPLGAYEGGRLEFKGGIVNLSRLVSVEGDDVPLLQSARRLRLGPTSLQAFQERIGGAFSRTGLPAKEKLPEFLGLPAEMEFSAGKATDK